MQENKSLVQEALIQMKNVEEAIAENAKGILASTMKEEINQLVKESLSEQKDDEIEVDSEVDVDTTDVDDETPDMDDIEMSNDMELDMDVDSEETPIDLTDIEDEETLLKVFKAMGEDDGIVVVKDDDEIHLTDNDEDAEYIIKLGESINKKQNLKEMHEEEKDQEMQDLIDQIFSETPEDVEVDTDVEMVDEMMDDEMMVDDEEVVYEIEFNEESDDDDDESMSMDEESDDDDDESMSMDEESDDDDDESMSMDEENWEESMDESYNPKKAAKKIGKGYRPKFTYEKTTGGFNEKMKEGPKSVGTGSVKKAKSFPKGENTNGKNKVVGKKVETKEAARTYAFGSKNYPGRGLPKPKVVPNKSLKESLESEVNMLREKNEEYRKALNVFREKLNEVAIFNSNLAYATRLFTEHSTTKKEKINILRRFDGVETLRESKSLYKSIKDELSKGETKAITESVETKLNKNVSSGSSTSLIESKTYENPQFMRIKDLMGKIN